eukprot:m.257032 g.257032  ORF g.257032 m.257032 type:complete len:176 (+) comp34939_c0_seq1:7-534(+)
MDVIFFFSNMSIMEKANDFFAEIEGFCNQHVEHPLVKVLGIGEDKTGLKRSQILSGGVALVLLFIFIFFGLSFIATVVGVCYPCYMTLYALNGPQEESRRWLIYWMVFGVFAFKEQFSDLLLFWLPFFYEFKIAVLVFCMYPSKQNGATLLYDKFLIRFVEDESEFEDSVDSKDE